MSLNRDWPLFGLRVETPRLTLAYPTDDDLDALNAVASRGIHDPSVMPFLIPWTDDPPEIRPRKSLQFGWGLRPLSSLTITRRPTRPHRRRTCG